MKRNKTTLYGILVAAALVIVGVIWYSTGKPAELSVYCKVDDDCILINKELDYRLCWRDACKGVDYSLDKYIAVNKLSGEEFIGKNRPTEERCGPAPACPSFIINDNFVAKCIDNICKKVPK